MKSMNLWGMSAAALLTFALATTPASAESISRERGYKPSTSNNSSSSRPSSSQAPSRPSSSTSSHRPSSSSHRPTTLPTYRPSSPTHRPPARPRPSVVTPQSHVKHPVSYSRHDRVVVRPQRVKVVNSLPSRYVSVRHNGMTFYSSAGRYYRRVDSRYVLVFPPIGLRVSLLPTARRSFYYHSRPYYCYEGALYRSYGSGYEVVAPQVGMVIPELPSVNVETVFINNNIYFEFDNVLYMEIATRYGVQYEVVGRLDADLL